MLWSDFSKHLADGVIDEVTALQLDSDVRASDSDQILASDARTDEVPSHGEAMPERCPRIGLQRCLQQAGG